MALPYDRAPEFQDYARPQMLVTADCWRPSNGADARPTGLTPGQRG